MYLGRFLRALAEDWPSVECYFTSDTAAPFRSLVEQLITSREDEQRDAAEQIAMMMASLLPEGHPVRLLINAEAGTTRSALTDMLAMDSGPGNWDRPEDRELIEEMRRLLLPEMWRLFGPHDPGHPMESHEIAAEAEAWLLEAPALSASEVLGMGADPGHQHLIRLDSEDGVRLPSFQFDETGQPIPLVLNINKMLDADADPWGVADWWLGRHSWLPGSPADALGEVPDHVLLASARALTEGC